MSLVGTNYIRKETIVTFFKREETHSPALILPKTVHTYKKYIKFI